MKRMTRSVAMLANVEMVTLSMLCTALHRCWSGDDAQFDEIGVHQNAMSAICTINVTRVKTQATPRPILTRLPCSENSE